MKIQIIFAGPAGTGPNILTHVLASALVQKGYHVFYSRDYPSLIRGGNNFNILTFSEKPVYSNESKSDILVSLEEKSSDIYKEKLRSKAIILEGKYPNMYFAGKIFHVLGLDFKSLDDQLKILKKRYEENIQEAKKGYEDSKTSLDIGKPLIKNPGLLENGSQGISQGAIKSGLDIYYAYPMTPATPVLVELAQATLDKNSKHKTIELENEISVANAGVGSSIVGKKVMVGTAGGGFDLMSETLSLCGIAEVPLVFYLAQRPGPGTGVATYTSQGDLKIALNAGHGEFQRIVLAPGNPKEAKELTNQAFYLSQRLQSPSIILSDKHLGESYFTSTQNPSFIKIPNSTKLKRYNSYEQDPKTGSATEDPEIVKKEVEKRLEKKTFLEKEIQIQKFPTHKFYGNKDSKHTIISWGSTQGAILDTMNNLDCKFIQILYLEPFPKEILNELKTSKKVLLVENNSTGLLGELIKQQTGFDIPKENKILRYDGRPFLSDQLNDEMKKRLK